MTVHVYGVILVIYNHSYVEVAVHLTSLLYDKKHLKSIRDVRKSSLSTIVIYVLFSSFLPFTPLRICICVRV